MSYTHTHHITAEGDRIALPQKLFYGTGQITNIILALSIANLAPFVLTVELKVNPFLVGLAMGLPRLWDAFTDPVVGYLSDQTRSRWGRRKPYLLGGSIAVAICLALMWQLPGDWSEMAYFWYFLVMSLFFYLAYTLYATPYVAWGYELTPDYHERTRLMGAMNFVGQVAAVPMAWLFAFTEWDVFEDGVQGARVLAIILAVAVVGFALIPVLFVKDPTKERFLKREAKSEKEKLSFMGGLKTTLKNPSFRCLCFATFAFFPGLILIQNLASYLVIYFVYGGDQDASSILLGWSGTLATVLGIAFVPLVTYMGTRMGKRLAFMTCAGLALFGCILKWWCYQPTMPYMNLIPGPFIGIGFSALWILMSSMMADVCDEDELQTGERREGAYSSIYWWIVKLGLSAALVASGVLLNLTGFDEDLVGNQTEQAILYMRLADMLVPSIFILISIYFVKKFPLTEERCYEIRQKLEERRGEIANSV